MIFSRAFKKLGDGKEERSSCRLTCILCGILASVLTAVIWFSLPTGVAEAAKKGTIKFATLAPEGSSWMKQMRLLEKEIKKATKGEVRFKFYPGGVSGDEKDVIRKMRIGQLHAAGFTGVGLGEILPEVRVLDLPFLFQNDKEITHVYKQMTPHFEKAFEKKGYILLGWVPVGWVYFFSQENINTLESLRATKAWLWEGDPLVQASYEAMKANPHPLSVTDVMMALQTGMVETVYASPMGALVLQWFSKVKVMSQIRMGHATGAVLMTKKQFKKIPESYRGLIRDISRKNLKKLVQKVHEDNEKSIKVMMKNGLKMGDPPAESELARFREIGTKVQETLTGKLFAPALLNQVKKYLAEVR